MHIKFKKEIQALLGGMACAYLFQLFGLLMVFIENPESDLLIAEAFIPAPAIQFAIVPLVSWILMGLLRVRWFSLWIKITAHAIAFLFPFVMIAMIALYSDATIWHSPIFWVANAFISLGTAFTVFRPITRLRMPDETK